MATRETAPQQKDYPKLVTLAVLHMAQSFPGAFAGTALPFMFRKEGLPLEMFWLLALPGIPRFLKWLMALVVDNYGSARLGHRKTWIIPCTIIGTLAYAALAFIPPSLHSVYAIVAILLFATFVMAAYDITADAYAAESMTNTERPVGTMIINVLGSFATVLGTSTIALVDRVGWRPTMLGASVLLFVAALPAIIRREPPPPQASQIRRARGESPSLWKALQRRDSGFILPFAFTWGFGAAFFGSMVGPFFADKGMTLTEYGIMQPISFLAGSTLASIATPWLVDRIGLGKTALIGVCAIPLEGVMFAFLALTPLPALPTLIAMVSVMGFATHFYSSAVTISRYRWASRAQAGTDYSMQSSMTSFGVWASGSIAGWVAAQVGWVYFFPLTSLVAVTGGAFYVVMFNRIETLVQDRERLELEV